MKQIAFENAYNCADTAEVTVVSDCRQNDENKSHTIAALPFGASNYVSLTASRDRSELSTAAAFEVNDLAVFDLADPALPNIL